MFMHGSHFKTLTKNLEVFCWFSDSVLHLLCKKDNFFSIYDMVSLAKLRYIYLSSELGFLGVNQQNSLLVSQRDSTRFFSVHRTGHVPLYVVCNSHVIEPSSTDFTQAKAWLTVDKSSRQMITNVLKNLKTDAHFAVLSLKTSRASVMLRAG